jgi:hypothetical protein
MSNPSVLALEVNGAARVHRVAYGARAFCAGLSCGDQLIEGADVMIEARSDGHLGGCIEGFV